MYLFKKSISTILIVILLIFVSLGAFFVLNNWYESFNLYFQSNYKAENQNSLGNTEILGVKDEILYFKNNLGSNLILNGVWINGEYCDFSSINLSEGYNEINISNCSVDSPEDNLYDFELYTDAGIYYKKYLVNDLFK